MELLCGALQLSLMDKQYIKHRQHPVMPADSRTWPNGLFFMMQEKYVLSCLCAFSVVHIYTMYTKYMKNFKMNVRDVSETKNGNIKFPHTL